MRSFISCSHKYVMRLRDAAGAGEDRGSGIYGVDLPKELQEKIIAKQEEEFAFTYSDREYLYIARGYGEQETGGYCISIDECYRTSNTICVKTTLTGPENGEKVQTAPSYPFIVIKLEMRSEEVVFQ